MADIITLAVDAIFVVVNLLSLFFVYRAYSRFAKGDFKKIVMWTFINLSLIFSVRLIIAYQDFFTVSYDVSLIERLLLVVSACGIGYLGWMLLKFSKIYSFKKP